MVHHGLHEYPHDHYDDGVPEEWSEGQKLSSPEVVVVARAWAHRPLGYFYTFSDGSAAVGATLGRFLENRILTSQTSQTTLRHPLVVTVVLVEAVVDHDADPLE